MTSPPVIRLCDRSHECLANALGGIGLRIDYVARGHSIPGSFWGSSEAGLVGGVLYARFDTPLHSILHEAGHYACMDHGRRHVVDTDAGGDDAEEVAVCYWQVLATDWLPDMGRSDMLADMDRWGYTFRLGSAERWFTEDAEDARDWLGAAGLLEPETDRLIKRLRQS